MIDQSNLNENLYGIFVKYFREKEGLNIEVFAEKVRFQQALIEKFESGDFDINFEKLERMLQNLKFNFKYYDRDLTLKYELLIKLINAINNHDVELSTNLYNKLNDMRNNTVFYIDFILVEFMYLVFTNKQIDNDKYEILKYLLEYLDDYRKQMFYCFDGISEFNKLNYKKASDLLEKANDVQKKLDNGVVEYYLGTSLVHQENADLFQAYRHIQKSKDMFKRYNNYNMLVIANAMLANCYYIFNSDMFVNRMVYECENILKDVNNIDAKDEYLFNFAKIFVVKKEYDKAVSFLYKIHGTKYVVISSMLELYCSIKTNNQERIDKIVGIIKDTTLDSVNNTFFEYLKSLLDNKENIAPVSSLLQDINIKSYILLDEFLKDIAIEYYDMNNLYKEAFDVIIANKKKTTNEE